jgi:glutaminyl-peptide cyclotransferase
MRLIILFLALLAGPAAPAQTGWTIAQTFDHDRTSFTQGLFIAEGMLYESTGLNGQSKILAINLKTGKAVRSVALDRKYFGEGIAPWKDRIISLTWQAGEGFVWDRKTLRKLKSFSYPGEGWGITQDGKRLIMSDGTEDLRLLDPESLKETGRITVTWQGQPVPFLNELEYVDGEIFANIWYSPQIARIDPKTGQVRGWIDLSKLVEVNHGGNRNAVLNGIAWDAKARLLYVTGKNWPKLYALRLASAPPKPGQKPGN